MTKIIEKENLKQFRQRLDLKYAFNDGSYENMTVGNAEQLNSARFTIDNEVYLFRTSGGSVDIGNRAFNTIVGGSLAPRNVHRSSADQTSYGVTASCRNCNWTLSGTCTDDRLYIGMQDGNSGNIANGHWYAVIANDWSGANTSSGWYITGEYSYTSNIVKKATANTNFAIKAKSGYDFGAGFLLKVRIIDLTVMFGASFMDELDVKIPNNTNKLKWLLKYFPNISDFNFDGGNKNIRSVTTSKYSTIGFNQYDHTSGSAKLLGGYLYQITGDYTSLTYVNVFGKGEPLTLDQDGCFTPTYNGTLTVTDGNGINTCVHLVWSGYRNGEYEPFIKREYALDGNLTLRGIPKLTEGGELYFDGDEYLSDGTVLRKYGVRAYTSGDENDGTVFTNGTTTVYPLDTTVTEIAQPYNNIQIVDDFGTEEFTDGRTFKMPVGHVTKYAPNLRDKLQNLPDIPSDTGDYVVHYDKPTRTCMFITKTSDLPALPTQDGTYKLICTVINGEALLSWGVENGNA